MKDEGNVRAAPWRWRTGWLNQRDDEIDDGSSSGMVDEGRRGVAMAMSSGKKLRLGGRRSRVWGFVTGFRGLGVRVGGWMGWQWGTMA